MGKALDMFDNAVTDARASHGAQREAKQFAATVVPGKTYYSVVELNRPWGKSRALMEWVFEDRRGFATGQYMSGHLSAAGVWLGWGPIHATRPAGLKTFRELDAGPEFPPEVTDVTSLSFAPARV
jgi:hypothetical protein